MPRKPQPETAFGVDVGTSKVVVARIPGLGGDVVELGNRFDGLAKRAGDLADVGAELAQDFLHLAVLVAFQDDALGAQMRDLRGLDEYGFAGAAGAMDDAGQLVPIVDRYGQNVMIAADRRVRIAQDFAQLGVAQEMLDSSLGF